MKKKISWWVIVTGAIVGLSAVLLTHFGNPANMGFCIACFLRDIAGSLGLHSAGKVQYIRPEIIGLVLGAFLMSVAGKEFKARAGSSPALRFVIGAFVVIGALAFLGCHTHDLTDLGCNRRAADRTLIDRSLALCDCCCQTGTTGITTATTVISRKHT